MKMVMIVKSKFLEFYSKAKREE